MKNQQPQQQPFIEAVFVKYQTTVLEKQEDGQEIKVEREIEPGWTTDVHKHNMNETTGVVTIKRNGKQIFGLHSPDKTVEMNVKIVQNPNYRLMPSQAAQTPAEPVPATPDAVSEKTPDQPVDQSTNDQ